jgi:DNA-binding PadR family transcriptional regulator
VPATGPTRPLPITDLDELRAALGGQDERERFVIEMRYGLADGHQHSLAWIGRRLRLSAERVRQLEAQALERLGSQERGRPAPRPNGQKVPKSAGEPPRTPARQRFLRPWTLLLLWHEPAHGADLRERLAALGMPGADYRFLRSLEAEGLLRSTWAHGEGVGPDRRVYSLTNAGLEQLERDAEALGNVADALAAFLDRHRRSSAA